MEKKFHKRELNRAKFSFLPKILVDLLYPKIIPPLSMQMANREKAKLSESIGVHSETDLHYSVDDQSAIAQLRAGNTQRVYEQRKPNSMKMVKKNTRLKKRPVFTRDNKCRYRWG
jgi:hypothetical protein